MLKQGKMIQDFESNGYFCKFKRNGQEYVFRASSPSTQFQWIEEQCKTEEDFQRYINSPLVNFKPLEITKDMFTFFKNYSYKNYYIEDFDLTIQENHIIIKSSTEYGVDWYEDDDTVYPDEMYENPFEEYPYVDKGENEPGYYLMYEDKEYGEYQKAFHGGSCEGLTYMNIESREYIDVNEEFYIEIDGTFYLKFFDDKDRRTLLRVSQDFLEVNLQYLSESLKKEIKERW